jgi:hypothetical protein
VFPFKFVLIQPSSSALGVNAKASSVEPTGSVKSTGERLGETSSFVAQLMTGDANEANDAPLMFRRYRSGMYRRCPGSKCRGGCLDSVVTRSGSPAVRDTARPRS